MRSHEEWLTEASRILEGLGADVVVMGAVAALQYRRSSRNTADIDILTRRVEGLRAAFEKHGYEVKEISDPGGDPFLFRASRGDARVDIIFAETPYQEEAIERAIDGFLSPEDVILHKLIAWRARDRDDIRSILEGDEKLDTAYITRWAREWDVTDRWRESRTWRSE